MAWSLVGWCTVSWSRYLFSAFQGLKICHDECQPGLDNAGNFILERTTSPELDFSDNGQLRVVLFCEHLVICCFRFCTTKLEQLVLQHDKESWLFLHESLFFYSCMKAYTHFFYHSCLLSYENFFFRHSVLCTWNLAWKRTCFLISFISAPEIHCIMTDDC